MLCGIRSKIARRDGRLIFFYRGERRIPSGTGKRNHAFGAATSEDWVTWTKANGGNTLFVPNGGNNAVPRSALLVNDRIHLTVATHDSPIPETRNVPVSMYLKESAVTGDPFSWDDGPGTLMYKHTAPYYDGGSYVVDDRHYMAFAVIPGVEGVPYKVDLAMNVA